MELGIKQAVELARSELNISSFPDLHVILWPSDESHLNKNAFKDCTLPMPPVLSQNRDFETGNMLVLAPDFSFFTDFWGGYDHGSAEDIWFDVVEAERVADNANKAAAAALPPSSGDGISSGKYCRRNFEDKSMTAIYRGKIAQRKFAYLRSTVTESAQCRQGDNINATSSQYVTRADMCTDHQAIITIPGNGVWSWATKFNLVGVREYVI
jgi:hypothetical protein